MQGTGRLDVAEPQAGARPEVGGGHLVLGEPREDPVGRPGPLEGAGQ